MNQDDHLLRGLLHGSAPLLVWALHFFGVYGLVAMGCCRALEASLRPLLLLAGAIAAAAIVVLLARTPSPRGSVLWAAGVGSGVLALTGVLWTTVPVLSLPLCRCG